MKGMPPLEAFGISDKGPVRENNEDRCLVDMALGLAIVADGMGGAACGEIASALTVETVSACLKSPAEALAPEQLVKEAIREANRRVLARARQEAACDGMGSTIVAAYWTPPRLVIANVGDSRAYLFRGGELSQLSYDQTLANELRRTLHLSDEQIAEYPHRNVLTMAIGSTDDLAVQTREETLAPGDEILLCSDGLWGAVSDEAIAEILAERRPLRETVEKLVETAKTRRSEDNITAVVLRCG
jgi:protein phosphatase